MQKACNEAQLINTSLRNTRPKKFSYQLNMSNQYLRKKKVLGTEKLFLNDKRLHMG